MPTASTAAPMGISGIAMTLAQTPSNQIYVQSVSQIRSFVGWLEDQQTPPPLPDSPDSPQAINAFSQMKTDTMQWINSIYPQCIELPQAFVSADSQITPSLNTLVSLAQQLTSQPTNQNLHNAIVQAATSLSTTIQGLNNQVGSLVGSLASSSTALSQDSSSVGTATVGMNQDVNNELNNIYQLQGQLTHLQNQTCPSQSAINACQQNIANAQSALNQMQNLSGLLQQAGQQASAAANGLSYMAGYWSTVQTDAQQVIGALGKLASDPPAVLNLDLQNAAQSWSQTLALSQQLIAGSSTS